MNSMIKLIHLNNHYFDLIIFFFLILKKQKYCLLRTRIEYKKSNFYYFHSIIKIFKIIFSIFLGLNKSREYRQSLCFIIVTNQTLYNFFII